MLNLTHQKLRLQIQRLPWVPLLFSSFAWILLILCPNDTWYNGPFRLAREMLHGKLYLPHRLHWIEMYQYKDHFYIGYPPMVSAILAPLIGLTGGSVTQPYFNAFFFYGTSFWIYLILREVLSFHITTLHYQHENLQQKIPESQHESLQSQHESLQSQHESLQSQRESLQSQQKLLFSERDNLAPQKALLSSKLEVKACALLGAFAYLFATPTVIGVTDGSVWTLMHSEGNFFLSLAIYLALVKNRFFGAGISFMISALCRHSILFGGLAFLLIAWKNPLKNDTHENSYLKIFRFGLGASIPLLIGLGIQTGMTGSPFISPYTLQWKEWSLQGNTVNLDFGWRYVLPNVKFYFTSHPLWTPVFPYLKFRLTGQSIWSMSPFFFGILTSYRLKSSALACLWAGAIPMFIFYLFYSYTGYAQIGNRYISDIYPFLVVIAIVGFFPLRKWSGILLASALFYSALLLWVVVPLAERAP